MTETEARLWITNMRECLHADTGISPQTLSMFNDVLRFLEEFCCPNFTADACRRAGIWICPECGARGYAETHCCGDGS